MKILRTKASDIGYREIVEMSESEIIALFLTADEFCSFIVYSNDEKRKEYILEIKDYDTYVEW